MSFALKCRRLLQAARCALPNNDRKRPPLPCFALNTNHVETLSSPQDFHKRLCDMILNANHRVHLASLYIGTGSSRDEEEFLNALSLVASNVEVKILLDENRATRVVKDDKNHATTSSAQALNKCLQESGGGLYLFPALSEPRRSLLPSPLNEIAGVFHIKAYIVDDELILSGANLSQEYFLDRQDRYMVFRNGGGGLVDFYCRLVNILCQYGYRYPSTTENNKRLTRGELKTALERLFDGSNCSAVATRTDDDDDKTDGDDSSDLVAYAVPTFQVPKGFFSTKLDFWMDTKVTRNLLLSAYEMDSSTHIQLASAYLNPTLKLISILKRFDNLQLLTAGPKSHGFAPKPNRANRRGDWIPTIFSALYAQLENNLPHAQFLYYERDGWTFHAKGLWIKDENEKLVATMIGSGNYGARSEVMDVESNTILLFPQQTSKFQESLESEWNSLCEYAHTGHAIEFPQTSWRIRATLPIIRDLF